jgi:Zn-dependent peptidase ImmA (M78 family)/transcriptional regulator with XRE-family HTH domain
MAIGDRLRALREGAQLSQARVGAALGLSASQISRAENDKRQLSAYELGVIAGEFGWDVRELLGIERPRVKMAVAARLRAEDGSPADAFRRAADLVEVDSLLDDITPAHQSNGLALSWPMPAPTTFAQALREGEEAASAVRDKLGVRGPITDLLSLCERELGVDVLIAPISDECDGAIAIAENLAIVVTDSTTMSGRQRFTIAHELGHGILGDVRDVVLTDEDPSGLVEERAQAFASAFLMPEDELTNILGSQPGPTELAEAMVRLGVSWSALVKRCARIGITIDEHTVALEGPEVFERAGRSDEVDRLSEPIAARPPARIVRRVRDAYADALIGAGIVGMCLGISGDELDRAVAAIPTRFELPPASTAL